MQDFEEYRTAAERLEGQLQELGRDCAGCVARPISEDDMDRLELALTRLRLKVDELNRLAWAYVFACRKEAQESGVTRPPVTEPQWRAGRLIESTPAYFESVRYRLRGWEKMGLFLRAVVADEPRPLYPNKRPLWDALGQQTAVSDAVYRELHKVMNPTAQAESAQELGCHPDIPLKPSEFYMHAHAALRICMAQKRQRPLRFIDVGCGGGMKVLMASHMFDVAHGLEYDPGYVEVAERMLALLGASRCSVTEGDALTFKHYGDYDVIYFYQPMVSVESLIKLERRIAREARPGTILIAPYGMFVARAGGLGCTPVAGAVYVVGATQEETDDLRSRAEWIGPCIPNPDGKDEARDAFMAPLIEVCRRIGYNPN